MTLEQAERIIKLQQTNLEIYRTLTRVQASTLATAKETIQVLKRQVAILEESCRTA